MTQKIQNDLELLSRLVLEAQHNVREGDPRQATSILQGEAAPLLQTVAREVFYLHAQSGVVG